MSEVLLAPPFDLERDDWGAQLLREWATEVVKPGQRVLIVGAGAGGVGVPLARAGAKITFIDDNVSGLAAAQMTFRRTKLPADFATTLDFAPTEPFDLALINILWWTDTDRGTELLALAAQHLRPNGIIAVAGGKNAGIRSVEPHLEAIAGPVSSVVYKKGHRVIAASCAQPKPAPQSTVVHGSVAIRGVTLELQHRAGVFAGGALYPASAMLLEAVQIPAHARVLDLGCGSGILGMVVARLEPSATVTFLDSNVLAVEATRTNLAHNGLNGRVLASDSIEAVKGEHFDLIISNPPFHLGRLRSEKLAVRFIHDAALVAAPNAQFWLVANRFLAYEPEIRTAWSTVKEMSGDGRFKVLRAE